MYFNRHEINQTADYARSIIEYLYKKIADEKSDGRNDDESDKLQYGFNRGDRNLIVAEIDGKTVGEKHTNADQCKSPERSDYIFADEYVEFRNIE